MGKGSADHHKTAVAGIAFVRIFLGLFFLFAAVMKLFTMTDAPPQPGTAPSKQPVVVSLSSEGFIAELKAATGTGGDFVGPDSALPQYAQFLQQTVYPNAESFSWLIIAGEGAVGLFLLIGLFTRITAVIAMLISATYLLATMHLYPPVGLAGNAAFLAMECAVLIGNAGKTAGFDALLGKKAKRTGGSA